MSIVEGRGLVAGGLTLCAALGWHSHAKACSPPRPDLVHVALEVPADGLILGQLRCSDCTTDDLVFRTSAGDVVGSFVEISGLDDASLFAFQPAEPLPISTVDDQLLVGVRDRESDGVYVTVIAPSDEETTAKSTLNSFAAAGPTLHMCEEYSPVTAGLCGSPTYSSDTVWRAALHLDVEHGAQYFYRATYSSAEGEEALVGLMQDVNGYAFEGTPEEVCYALERLALDGTAVTVSEECTSTDDLELGTFDRLYGDQETTLGYCVKPPTGEKDAWCAHFAEALRAQSCEGQPQDACEAALAACDPETTDTTGSDVDPDETTTGDSGEDEGTTTTETDDTTSTAGDTAEGDTAEDDSSTTDRGSPSDATSDQDGCSIRGPSPGMKTTWFALPGVLLLVTLARRRSRQLHSSLS